MGGCPRPAARPLPSRSRRPPWTKFAVNTRKVDKYFGKHAETPFQLDKYCGKYENPDKIACQAQFLSTEAPISCKPGHQGRGRHRRPAACGSGSGRRGLRTRGAGRAAQLRNSPYGLEPFLAPAPHARPLCSAGRRLAPPPPQAAHRRPGGGARNGKAVTVEQGSVLRSSPRSGLGRGTDPCSTPVPDRDAEPTPVPLGRVPQLRRAERPSGAEPAPTAPAPAGGGTPTHSQPRRPRPAADQAFRGQKLRLTRDFVRVFVFTAVFVQLERCFRVFTAIFVRFRRAYRKFCPRN